MGCGVGSKGNIIVRKKLSPNWLTAGTAFFLLSGVQVIWFLDKTMRNPLPAWAHVYMAFTVWIAQTLDAIDGKHARKTNQSSPVGQLLDHGADAFCNCFTTCMLCASFGFGDSFITLFILIYVQCIFWIINWEEHLTGTLRTHVDGVGGTEMQFIGMFMLIFPAFDVYDIHKYKLPHTEITLMDTVLYLTILMGLFNLVLRIFKDTLINLEGEKRRRALLLIISPALILSSELLFYKSQIFAYHTVESCVLGGIVFGFYMSKFIISTMSKKEMELVDWDTIAFVIIQLLSFFLLTSFWEQIILYSIFGLIAILRYLRYVISIVKQLLAVLNLRF